MITVPTLLILGAGASNPFGYPTGEQLVTQIWDSTHTSIAPEAEAEHPLNCNRRLRELGFSRREMRVFGRRLLLSQKGSVDAFLEHNQEFREIGKAAILLQLAACSSGRELRHPDWYRVLWKAMDSPLKDFHKNRLAIVTFNYDHSIENFLLHAIQSTYSLNKTSSKRLLDKIPIVHFYGSLGRKHENVYSMPKPPSTRQELQELTSNLKIICDDHSSDAALKLIVESERICFLGFGFHSTNLRRLHLHKSSEPLLSKDKIIYASGFGLCAADRWYIRRHCFDESNPIRFGLENWTCGDVLKNFGLFLGPYFDVGARFLTD